MKQGDQQVTVMGLFIAAFFFFISRSKPLPRLSKQRPPARIFTVPLFTSLFCQFAVHLACLAMVVTISQPYVVLIGYIYIR